MKIDYKIEFHPEAHLEYRESIRFYDLSRSGLGNRFQKAIQKSINKLALRPYSFPKTGKERRVSKVSSFPFLVIFEIWEERGLIFIIAIFHTSRDPDRIQDR